jgi:hypothetical protein
MFDPIMLPMTAILLLLCGVAAVLMGVVRTEKKTP